jgi:F-type H+-transporting ATPase subunit delta
LNNSKIANRYAKALYETALEKKTVEEIGADLNKIVELYRESDDFKNFVQSPTLPLSKKNTVLVDMFAKNVNELTLAFLRLLVKKNRIDVLNDSALAYGRLLDAENGIVHASVESAAPLTEDQLSAIKNILEKYLNKKVTLSTSVDESVLGGFRIRVNDILIENTVVHQLEKFKSVLSAG